MPARKQPGHTHQPPACQQAIPAKNITVIKTAVRFKDPSLRIIASSQRLPGRLQNKKKATASPAADVVKPRSVSAVGSHAQVV